ncbi:MAG: hypothetical protein IJ439_01705 [Tyzzerella sp.]|nr:hypothetical protein [Tyzzerella sp.]
MQKGKIILNRESFVRFQRQLRYDNVNGILHYWKMAIPVIVLTVFVCGKFLSDYYCQARELSSLPVPSTADFIVDMFKGMEKYEPEVKTKPFEIPAFYLFFNIYISYAIAKYPFGDLKGMGKNVLVNSKSRSNWIFSKFVWCAEIIVVFYVITYMVATGFSALTGSVTFRLNEEVNAAVSNIGLAQTNFLMDAIILPIVTSICISYVQLMLSFRFNLLTSNIVTIVVICLSAYYSNTFLVGNYLMLLRNFSVIGMEGVSTNYGYIICILLSIVSLFLSKEWFRRIDIF